MATSKEIYEYVRSDIAVTWVVDKVRENRPKRFGHVLRRGNGISKSGFENELWRPKMSWLNKLWMIWKLLASVLEMDRNTVLVHSTYKIMHHLFAKKLFIYKHMCACLKKCMRSGSENFPFWALVDVEGVGDCVKWRFRTKIADPDLFGTKQKKNNTFLSTL